MIDIESDIRDYDPSWSFLESNNKYKYDTKFLGIKSFTPNLDLIGINQELDLPFF